jgi:hypothetical protein
LHFIRYQETMGQLQSLTLHRKHNFLTQTSLRVEEIYNAKDVLIRKADVGDGNNLVWKKGKIVKIHHSELVISDEFKDSFFRLKDGRVVKVEMICGSDWQDLTLTCAVLRLENFFMQPFKSSEVLDVHLWKLNNWHSSFVRGVKLEAISYKYCTVPTHRDNKTYVMTPFGDDNYEMKF